METIEKWEGTIRDVTVRLTEGKIGGHIVEQTLSFNVSEAESMYSRPFDYELDRYIQAGMFAIDRISADGTLHKVASAKSHIVDGRCIRTAKIESCDEICPLSYIEPPTIMADGTVVEKDPYSCVPGTSPASHPLRE